MAIRLLAVLARSYAPALAGVSVPDACLWDPTAAFGSASPVTVLRCRPETSEVRLGFKASAGSVVRRGGAGVTDVDVPLFSPAQTVEVEACSTSGRETCVPYIIDVIRAESSQVGSIIRVHASGEEFPLILSNVTESNATEFTCTVAGQSATLTATAQFGGLVAIPPTVPLAPSAKVEVAPQEGLTHTQLQTRSFGLDSRTKPGTSIY